MQWNRRQKLLIILLTLFNNHVPAFALHPWVPPNDHCTLVTDHCVPIADRLNQTCLDIQLPYKLTGSQPIVDDVGRYDLNLWTALRAIPACWDKLLFFLCSVYIPECVEPLDIISSHNGRPGLMSTSHRSNWSMIMAGVPPSQSDILITPLQTDGSHRIILPEAEMCEAVHRACPLLIYDSSSTISENLRSTDGQVLLYPLPRFLDCSLYTRGCRQNSLTARLFQSTGSGCESPLVTTTTHENWLPGIERCGFPCRRPHFDSDHYSLARMITGISAAIFFVINIFVLITLRLQCTSRSATVAWVSSCSVDFGSCVKQNIGREELAAPLLLQSWWTLRSPLFCTHLFFLISCVGYLMPLIPVVGESIACHSDGTLRTAEPQVSRSKSLFCIFNFMMVYACLTSAAVWSLVLDHFVVSRARYIASLPPINIASCQSHNLLTCFWPSGRKERPKEPNNPQVVEGARLPTNLGMSKTADLPPGQGHCKVDYGEQNRPLLAACQMRKPTSPERKKNSSSLIPLDRADLGFEAQLDTRLIDPVGSPDQLSDTVIIRRPCMGDQSRPLLHQLLEACLKHSWMSEQLSSKHRTKQPFINKNSTAPQTQLNSVRFATHGRPKSSSSQSACLHILAFAPSLALTLVSLTASEIDGDSLTGICVVGRNNVWAKMTLVFLPSLVFLCVKVLYTSRLLLMFRKLQRRFSNSNFSVDQEFSSRIRRSAHAHVGVVLILFGCWLFSICVQIYVFLREPVWLESQRSVLLCKLSYRLLGLNSQSAYSACLSTTFPTNVDRSLSVDVDHVRPARSSVTENVSVDASVPEQRPRLWTSVSLSRPAIGPLMLQLLISFILNGISASACLCDRSVKQCWRLFLSKFTRNVAAKDSQYSCTVDELITTHFPSFFWGFSWWDPGLITPPMIHELFLASVVRSDLSLHLGEKPQNITPPVTDQFIHSVGVSDTHNSSNSVFGATAEDIIAQLERLIALYQSSTNPNPALPLFIHMRQQLLSAYRTHPDSCAKGHDTLGQLSGPPVSGNLDSSGQCEFFASVAALCNHLDKQLSVSASNTNVRRGRHRRLLAGKSIARRRSHSRSLSINELFNSPSFRSGQSASGPSSTVSRPGSDTRRSDVQTSSALSLLKAAASMLSGTSSLNCQNAEHPNATDRQARCTRGTDSVCDASQVSSSSVHDVLTRIASAMPSADSLPGRQRKHQAVGKVGPSISKRSLLHDATSLGSRMSLRSISGTSSSGAESYNSYRLLLNQAGAGWRELWRTRMLLMDVLRWAEAVAPSMQSTQNVQASSPYGATFDDSSEGAPGNKSSSDWGKQFVDIVASLIAQQQTEYSETTTSRQQTDTPYTFDPIMAAALTAATAAATIAMQQKTVRHSDTTESSIRSPVACGHSCFQCPQSSCQVTVGSPVHISPCTSIPTNWRHRDQPYCVRGSPANPIARSPDHHLISSDFRCQPDLLMNHNRSHLIACSSADCSPPFSVHRPPSTMPPYRGSIEHRAAMFVGSSDPSNVIQSYPYLVTPGQQPAAPFTLPVPNKTSPGYFSPSSLPGPRPIYPTVNISLHSIPDNSRAPNRSDDSDAFDSEDEVMSDVDAEKITLSETNFCNPSLCFPDYPKSIPSCEHDVTDHMTNSCIADDCDVSSVSQSASQVVPRFPSSSDVEEEVRDKSLSTSVGCDFVHRPTVSTPLFQHHFM